MQHEKLFAEAQAGDIILLSPANASWDMYPNFEVRGDEFITTFEELKGWDEKIIFTGGGTVGHVTLNLLLIPKFLDAGWQSSLYW